MAKEPVSKLLGWLVVIFMLAVAGLLYFTYVDTNDQLNLAGMQQWWPTRHREEAAQTNTSSNIPKGWKTYTSAKYGFSFGYPSTWTLSDETTSSPDDDLLNITLVDKTPREGTDLPDNMTLSIFASVSKIDTKSLGATTLKDYLDKYSALSDPVYAKVKETKVGGEDGYSAEAGSNQFGGGTYYFVKLASGKIMKIWDFENTQATTTANIRSTIQFNSDGETAGWKTYENKTEGYSMKYPATNWAPRDNTDESNISIASSKANYSIGISVASSNLTLSNYIASLKTEAARLINNGQPGNTYGTESSTTIGGQTAIKITNCTQGVSAYRYDWYFVKKGAKIYKISITKRVGEGTVFDTAPYITLAETMLTTFQFTK